MSYYDCLLNCALEILLLTYLLTYLLYHAPRRFFLVLLSFCFVICLIAIAYSMGQVIQDAQLSQRDRAAGCVTVFAKSRRLELGDNILRTL